MARYVTILNHKGGVGKTTTALFLGNLFSMAGKKVLLYDLDPQGWAAQALNAKERDFGSQKSLDGELLRKFIVNTKIKNLSLLWNSEAEEQLKENSLEDFQKSLERIRFVYDYILMDLPPGKGLLHRLVPACGICSLIPVTPDIHGPQSLSQTLETLQESSLELQKELKITGVLITRYRGQCSEDYQSLLKIFDRYPHLPFSTFIPEDSFYSLNFENGQPRVASEIASCGTYPYLEIAREILKGREYGLPPKIEERVLEEGSPSPSQEGEGKFLPTSKEVEQ